jgi:hypothetical protein
MGIPYERIGDFLTQLGIILLIVHQKYRSLHCDSEHRSLVTEQKLNNLKEEDYEEDNSEH